MQRTIDNISRHFLLAYGFLLYPEIEVYRAKNQQYSANMPAFHLPENL